jgi:hypothetical protein
VGYIHRSNNQEGPDMSNSIAAHKHRTRLHILRDRVQHALRDAKHGKAGAAERVVTHRAARAAYRAANPAAKPRA